MISKQGINIVGVIVIATIILCTIAVLRINKKENVVMTAVKVVENKEVITSNDCQDCVPRKIDGVMVAPGLENIAPVAVMIDNHSEARPAYSLSKANLVIEAEAEGGITRYLAFFASDENINEIGPVRSARSYYVDWANELSALYVHCGGSPGALAKIIQDKTSDLNEFFNGRYFWRTNDLLAPHNILTSTEKLHSYLATKDIESGDYETWMFAHEEAADEIVSPEISIPHKYPYGVKWVYNNKDGQYERYLAGERHIDADGGKINAKNIIIQYARTTVIDEELRLNIKAVDTGVAVLCKNGQCIEGEWRKRDKKKRTIFYNGDREVYIFEPGTTWIEVVRSDFKVEY